MTRCLQAQGSGTDDRKRNTEYVLKEITKVGIVAYARTVVSSCLYLLHTCTDTLQPWRTASRRGRIDQASTAQAFR